MKTAPVFRALGVAVLIVCLHLQGSGKAHAACYPGLGDCSSNADTGSQPVLQPPAAGCGWYAIAYCSQDAGVAQAQTGVFGGFVINTSDYAKFRPGWFCVVQGPMRNDAGGRDAANAVMLRMKAAGAGTAYIKNSCG